MKLEEAIKKFTDELSKLGRSPFTITAYSKDLEQLKNFSDYEDIAEIDKSEIERFLNYLFEDKGFAAKTVSRKLNSIRSLFSYLHEQGLIKNDPSNDIPHPEIKKKKARYLEESEYKNLRDTARDNNKLYAMIEFMLQTGLRISEISRLKLEHLKLESNPPQVLVVEYGSNPMRLVELNPKATEVLTEYLAKRQNPSSDEGYVFNTKNGSNMIVRNIRSAVNRVFSNAGIDDATVNDLRNTFIVWQLNAGVSLAKIAQMVGHKRYSSTEKYLELTDRVEAGKGEKLAIL